MDGVKFGFAAMKELKKSVLYQTLDKCKSVFWFVFWFSSAINILVLFLPLYTSQVLDRVLSSGSVPTLTMLSLVTIAALVCSSMLDVCRSLTMAKVADWIDRVATPDIIVRAISMTSVSGNLASGEAIRDLGMVKSFITGMGIFSLFDMPWAVVYLIAIFMIHPATGCIAVIGMVLLVLMALWNEMSTKKVMHEASEENVRNIGYIDVANRNSEVVEAMGMIRHIVSEWSNRNTQNRALQMKAQSRSNVILGITKFIRSVLQISVIGVGAFLATKGLKTAGGIIASSILMGRALAPFESAINTWKMLQSARISYRRLQGLLVSAPKREQAMALPAPKGAVLLDRVFYTPYGSNKPTIKGVSFAVAPGTVTGIIGASASGKSTLTKLIVGVWKPISGVVRLDGADVYTWNREDFGAHVGYLPQDIELFNATVKVNIARMLPNPDPEKVIQAAMIAGIHEMILQMPSGYDTVVGHGGVVLSGGQKQMLGLARAFYGDIRLLVLDEPNANLDGKAEACLINALLYAKSKGITTFVVTHKMQLLSAVEQVIVMDDGMMSAMGDRDEVLSRVAGARPQPTPAQPARPSGPPSVPVAHPVQPQRTSNVPPVPTSATSSANDVASAESTESNTAGTNGEKVSQGRVSASFTVVSSNGRSAGPLKEVNGYTSEEDAAAGNGVEKEQAVIGNASEQVTGEANSRPEQTSRGDVLRDKKVENGVHNKQNGSSASSTAPKHKSFTNGHRAKDTKGSRFNGNNNAKRTGAGNKPDATVPHVDKVGQESSKPDCTDDKKGSC